jgi:ferredoxin
VELLGALMMCDLFIEVKYDTCMGYGVCVDKCDQGAIVLQHDEVKGAPLEICALLESASQ